MKMDRHHGRNPNQWRSLALSHSVFHRAHGSATWAKGEIKLLAAVYGPKDGVKKNENPEKASIEENFGNHLHSHHISHTTTSVIVQASVYKLQLFHFCYFLT
ncbi:unnamed protein product [Lathyrus oleraceus]